MYMFIYYKLASRQYHCIVDDVQVPHIAQLAAVVLDVGWSCLNGLGIPAKPYGCTLIFNIPQQEVCLLAGSCGPLCPAAPASELHSC